MESWTGLSATSCKCDFWNRKWEIASSSVRSWIMTPPSCLLRHLIVSSSISISRSSRIVVATWSASLMLSTSICSLSEELSLSNDGEELSELLLLDSKSQTSITSDEACWAQKRARRRSRQELQRRSNMLIKLSVKGIFVVEESIHIRISYQDKFATGYPLLNFTKPEGDGYLKKISERGIL